MSHGKEISDKEFDCIKYKNSVQSDIVKNIKKMDHQQQIQYYRNQSKWFFDRPEFSSKTPK